jgi:hypothetical protein
MFIKVSIQLKKDNTVLETLLYLNTSHLQYSLCTVLLIYTIAVGLTELYTKLLTELVAIPDLTLTNHTEFKELICC